MRSLACMMALLACAAVCAGEKEAEKPKQEEVDLKGWCEVQFHLPICLPEAIPNDRPALQDGAKALKEFMGLPSPVQTVSRNPECCLWIELYRYGGRGYILLVARNGIRITAGDEASLNECVDYIKKNLKRVGERMYLPGGFTTTYKMRDAGAPQK